MEYMEPIARGEFALIFLCLTLLVVIACQSNSRGFTLIGVLITIAIIALVFNIMWSS